MNLVLHLTEQKLINPPHWLPANTHYLTIMRSIASGVVCLVFRKMSSSCQRRRTCSRSIFGNCRWSFGPGMSVSRIRPRSVISPHRRTREICSVAGLGWRQLRPAVMAPNVRNS
jgi:hypothetical protein